MRADLIVTLILAVQDAGASGAAGGDDVSEIITAAAALVAAVVSYFFGRERGKKEGERNARGTSR